MSHLQHLDLQHCDVEDPDDQESQPHLDSTAMPASSLRSLRLPEKISEEAAPTFLACLQPIQHQQQPARTKASQTR